MDDDAQENAAEFLAQHSQRIDADTKERQQLADASLKHHEDFTQPWKEVWVSLGSVLEQWRLDEKNPIALADAVRRIVRLAKQEGIEEKIRIASKRCRRLAEKDPTGRSFHLDSVADMAAVLLILRAAIEDDKAIEDLVDNLAITSPFLGEKVLFEVEHAGQMAEKPKQTEAAKTQAAGLLRDSLLRCRERLEAAVEKHRPLAVMLVHQAQLGNKPEPQWPENYENQSHHQLNLDGGPRCDFQQLFDANGRPAIGEKPFLDAEGKPMVYSDGSPIALYPGARRHYSLYGEMFRESTVADYSTAIDEYIDAAAELGRLLDALPQGVQRALWQGWPYGFVRPNPTDLWTNAVFELAWQKHPASRLAADRWAWHKNRKLKIADLAEWRDCDSPVQDEFAELLEHVGDPPAFWYSWIGNLWRASIGAIDLLLPMIDSVQNELPTPTANFAGQSSDANGEIDKSSLPRKPTVNERMKAELASNLEKVQGWTAKKWATHLGCGQTTVKDTETWKSLALIRKQMEADKRNDRYRR